MSISPLFPSLTEAISANINTNSQDITRKYHGSGCPCCAGGLTYGANLKVNGAPSSFGTTQALATQLTSESNGWFDDTTPYEGKWNLGATGTYAKNGILTYNVAGTTNQFPNEEGLLQPADIDGITDSNYLEQIRESIKFLNLSTGITFNEVTGNNADIDFTDNLPGAYQQYDEKSKQSDTLTYANKAQININDGGGYGLPSEGFGEFFSTTVLHEIYHALGLGHLGNYNKEIDFDTDAVFKNDSKLLSIMSYVDPADNPYIDKPNIGGGLYGASESNVSTGLVADLLSIDDLYAEFGFGGSKAFTDDTVYGFNTNITAEDSKIWNEFTTLAAKSGYSIVDGGGDDTIDLSGYSVSQLLDLRAFDKDSTSTYFSNIAGTFNNLSIAVGTIIENAIGGSAADIITGNSAANSINGLAGNDTLLGGAGNDSLDGGVGIDTALFSGTLNDYNVSFSLSGLRLIDQRAGSPDGTDTLTNIEFVDFNGVSVSWASLMRQFGPSPAPSFPLETAPTPTPSSIQTNDGFTQFTDADDTLIGQSNIKYRMMGGNDFLETIAGLNNFANGNMGDDNIVLRGGSGEYLGGKDSDTFEVFAAEDGTSVNGNRGEDTIIGSVSGVTYRGGKDNDTLAVSQGEVWGDLGVDVFRGVTGEGYAVIQDYIEEDLVELAMDGVWSKIESGLMFTDNSGDQIMLLVGISDIDQVTLT